MRPRVSHGVGGRDHLRLALMCGLLAALVLSSFGLGPVATAPAPSGNPAADASSDHGPLVGASPPAGPAVSSSAIAPSTSSISQTFDHRVSATARLLGDAGVPARDVRLPYVGTPARLVRGAVVPGYAAPPSNVSSSYSSVPAPSGITYYGENDTAGTLEATTLDASSLAGTVTVNQLSALYLDDDTPDMWGTQLNAVLTHVTLQGTGSYQFWTQNTIDYFQHNDSISFGEDTWNFSTPTAYIPSNDTTIRSHSPNGSVIGGLYIGEGPFLRAPLPLTLTLYLNSSLTSAGEQELWYNYSMAAAGGVHATGNYDWLIFNSTNPRHPSTAPLGVFEADGTQLDPVGLPNDFELDLGLGPYDGSTLDVLAANVSATLDYCPAVRLSCTSGGLRSVPAAEDFGAETGETSSGISLAYSGTTVEASAGPFILRGLWGFEGAVGTAPGATPVVNAITVSGSPEPTVSVPYVFVFFNGSTVFNPEFEWAPDVPVWYLPPGFYRYEVMLADYAEQTGTLVVGASPTRLETNLPYHPTSGVYTPLWAFNNSGLAGISASGTGSISDQYRLFNNPTADCSECGNAENANLSTNFFSLNDFLFPSFSGILIVGTDAYLDIDRPVSFCVFGFSWGPATRPIPGPYFYLQIELVATHHATLSNDSELGGWPAMAELGTLAGLVDAADNPFPQANVILWNSTNDLVKSNTFVPAWLVPAPPAKCGGVCPAITCADCVSPDGLLLYGGANNTVWGNTFRDPEAPSSAPAQAYAGLAEAESGDLIFNNYFSVDNPTVYLPYDIYNESCPDGYAGDCFPLILLAEYDTWNVSSQPASNVAAVVNGFDLSGNILGPACGNQGGNYWQDFGNVLNPSGVLPFGNAYDYAELASILPPGSAVERSIQLGGDFEPLTFTACTSGAFRLTLLDYEVVGLVVLAGTVVGIVEVVRRRWRPSPAPWLSEPDVEVDFPRSEQSLAGAKILRSARLARSVTRPSWRERWARHPPGLGLWVGAGLLALYAVAGVSALFVFRGSLGQLSTNPAWVPPFNPIAPSWAHPFGVLPGFGTDLFQAIWQATPWDLGIVAGILAIDATIGLLLGTLAGLNEGGILDTFVVFLIDSLGSIPSFILVIVVFAGLDVVAPGAAGLPVFVLVFGVVLWPTTARLVRERARAIVHEPYIEASRASGASSGSLLVRHIIPNSLGPILAQMPLDVAPIFFVLSAVPWFYNCGDGHPAAGVGYLLPAVPPFSPLPSASFPEWGFLLGFGTCEGFQTLGTFQDWWMFLFPLLAILVLGLAVGFLCDGIDRWRRLQR